MKNGFIIGLSLIIIFLAACGRRSYKVTNIFDKGVPAGIEKIHIDESYQLYRRDLRVKTKEVRISENKVEQLKELTSDPVDTGKVIEVEYLLISLVHNNAIYVTTIPDRRQVYYESNYRKEDTVNIQDFNTFHLGKIKGEKGIEFLFPDRRGSNTWDLDKNIRDSNTLILKNLIINKNGMPDGTMSIDSALADPIEFRHVGKPLLELTKRMKVDNKKVRARFTPLDNIIYMKKIKSNYQLLFRLSAPINTKDSTIVFKEKLVRHTPEPLLRD